MSFNEAVSAYFSAMQQKDLNAFSGLIADEDWISLILPAGQLIQGRNAILSFHADFFADPDWYMETTILQQQEIGATGLVLAEILYRDLDESGKPYEMRYYLNLLFCRQAGQWKVYHDQNTLIR